MYGDWYARGMYIQGHPQNLYHTRHYGHPSKFGFKDICQLWKAENFDPEGLMELYYKAGARYFVGQAMHHDHFFNYPSRYNKFNSTNMGPMKDICGLWRDAAKKYNLPFGLSEHLMASFAWFSVNKGCDSKGMHAGVPYDGNDPMYKDYYHENIEHYTPDGDVIGWYTKNEKHRAYYVNVIKEIIDLYQPELLYVDGVVPFGDKGETNEAEFKEGLETAAYLYNSSIRLHGQNRAIYQQKDQRPEIYNIGILDVEKTQLGGVHDKPWQVCTCIGGWFYDVKEKYKEPAQIIEMLVDIVSKNGCLLLNIPQLPDGTIDDEATFLLNELAKWNLCCSEGIYKTTPWRVYSEGSNRASTDEFTETPVAWDETDFRFTQKGDELYAFIMKPPENGTVVIRSLLPGEVVRSIRLLGGGELEFSQAFGVLTVKLPDKLPTNYVNCMAIKINK